MRSWVFPDLQNDRFNSQCESYVWLWLDDWLCCDTMWILCVTLTWPFDFAVIQCESYVWLCLDAWLCYDTMWILCVWLWLEAWLCYDTMWILCVTLTWRLTLQWYNANHMCMIQCESYVYDTMWILCVCAGASRPGAMCSAWSCHVHFVGHEGNLPSGVPHFLKYPGLSHFKFITVFVVVVVVFYFCLHFCLCQFFLYFFFTSVSLCVCLSVCLLFCPSHSWLVSLSLLVCLSVCLPFYCLFQAKADD
jgi:hypothetical protein